MQGPELVQPKPYLSCKHCEYFDKTMTRSGGVRGRGKYSTECRYSDHSAKYIYRNVESPGDKTPHWCPLIEGETMNGLAKTRGNIPEWEIRFERGDTFKILADSESLAFKKLREDFPETRSWDLLDCKRIR